MIITDSSIRTNLSYPNGNSGEPVPTLKSETRRAAAAKAMITGAQLPRAGRMVYAYSDAMSRVEPKRSGSRRARYLEIKDELVARYIDGQLADSPIPPERSLAQDFDVTRPTIRRAVDELERDGLVYRVQGGGTFCVGPGIAKSLRLTSFSEDIRARGRTPGSVLLSADEHPAGEVAGQRLRISPGAAVIEIRRLRLADAEPMCLESSALPAELVPGIERRNLRGSLYRLLESEYGIRPAWAEQSVSATVLSADEADQLRVAPFSAALRAERVSFDARARRVEFGISIYRADRYSLRYTVRRDS